MNKSQHLRDFEDSLDMVQFGAYLGFPKCCVIEFRDYLKACKSGKISGKMPPPRPTRKLSGTGYIPCEECNKKSIAHLLKTIRTNRMCLEPFPDYGVKQIKAQRKISK